MLDRAATSNVTIEVLERKEEPDAWSVEIIEREGEGDCFVTVFYGPESRQRAEEYADWKRC